MKKTHNCSKCFVSNQFASVADPDSITAFALVEHLPLRWSRKFFIINFKTNCTFWAANIKYKKTNFESN